VVGEKSWRKVNLISLKVSWAIAGELAEALGHQMDLSAADVPAGTQLALGSAVIVDESPFAHAAGRRRDHYRTFETNI
jgi:hypothetical protein